LRQAESTSLMQGGSHRRLNRLQIELAVAATLLKNHPQEPV